jgi:hypothetical protein
MEESEEMSNLDLAKAAAANAIANCKSDNATWKKSYLQPASEMIQNALFTVIEEFTRIRDAREKVLLDKIEELKKKIEGLSVTQTAPKTQYSDFAAALAKPESRANIAPVNAVSANAKISENKAKNAVFVGVPQPAADAGPNADKETVSNILKDIHVNAKIVYARRIRPRATGNAETTQRKLNAAPTTINR